MKPTSDLKDITLVQLVDRFATDEIARKHLESIRWHNGIVCPKCGCTAQRKFSTIAANPAKQVRAGLRWCAECKSQFTVTIGTIFEDSHIPLRKWLIAFYIVDATTIQLLARSLDWARHRRRKAAAKCHLRLDLQTFLPRYAIVDSAGEHDSQRAHELCARIGAGEIVIFDKAYVDFDHLAALAAREVFWVTRAKHNLHCRVTKKLPAPPQGHILRDDLVHLATPVIRQVYPAALRRVTALVEVEGQLREMIFLTNNLAWSAQTIADLYRCRWSIEVFFKELKQTLQLADFLGHSERAVKWQVWTALLAYVLLRFCAHLGRWPHSFTRLFALIRSALWHKLALRSLLEAYGTASGGGRFLGQPAQAFLAGFG